MSDLSNLTTAEILALLEERNVSATELKSAADARARKEAEEAAEPFRAAVEHLMLTQPQIESETGPWTGYVSPRGLKIVVDGRTLLVKMTVTDEAATEARKPARPARKSAAEKKREEQAAAILGSEAEQAADAVLARAEQHIALLEEQEEVAASA